MANFPSSPSVGQTYTTPAGVTYEFTSDGAWKTSQGIYAFATYSELVTGLDTTKSAAVREIARLARFQPHNYIAATGTANALTVTLSPALPEYSAGLVLRILTGASPNNDAMTINANGLGSKNLLRRSGSAVASGDVPANSLIEIIYDGTAFRLLAVVRSDIIAALSSAATPPQLNFFDLTTQNTQNVGSSVVTVITDFAVTASKASDAVFGSGGTITIGPNTAGVWAFSQTYLPSQNTSAATRVQAYLQKNGLAVKNQTEDATFCTNAGVVKVVAGDTLRMAVWQNSGNTQTNQFAGALPQTTTFNLYHISG